MDDPASATWRQNHQQLRGGTRKASADARTSFELAEAHRRELETDLAALRNQVIQDEQAATAGEREQALAKKSAVEMNYGRSVSTRRGR